MRPRRPAIIAALVGVLAIAYFVAAEVVLRISLTPGRATCAAPADAATLSGATVEPSH
jgi:hypothetical protein